MATIVADEVDIIQVVSMPDNDWCTRRAAEYSTHRQRAIATVYSTGVMCQSWQNF